MADVNVNDLADQAPTMAPPIVLMIKSRLTSDGDALQITPVNNNKAFSPPSSFDALNNFVNELGYPKLVRNLSNVRKHKFHPRPDSPLHLPNEEPVLGYLKFSAKGTKREVFGMPIPSNLITSDIQARKSRPGFVTKRRKPASSLRSVDETVAEGIPEKEPRVDDEEADVRTSTPTGSSIHDESSSLYAELGLTDSEVESDEDLSGIDAIVQGEGQAGPNPGDAAASQPLPSPVVHAGPNLEHMDLEVTDISTQPHPEQMDEGFTAMTYPKVQENLKLTVEEQVILEELASSTRTLTKAESMVSITIQQDTSLIPPMTTSVINFTSRPESPNMHQPLKATVTETTTTITTIRPPPSQPQQSTTDSMLMKRISKLEHIMANLIQDNKHLEERDLPEADMKEILHQRMWETNSYKTHKDHMMLYEALKKSMNRDHSEELLKDIAEARKKKKKRRDSPKRHLGLYLISHLLLHHQQVHLELQDLLELLDPHKFCHHLLHIHPPTKKYQMEECHKLLTNSVDDSIIRHNVSKPLPLGGPPGQVTIQSDFFFNKDLKYLRYGSKDSRHALSISKMKATYYPDVGLEQMVPDQMWIEEECKYDIAAIVVRTHMRILSVVRIKVFSMYGYDYMKKIVLRRADLNEHIIAKRDFKYLYPSDFEDLYLLNLQGYLNHLPPKDKKILTTAVNLWTRHLVIRQRVEDFQLWIESYQTQLNLTNSRWDATGFEDKHDFMVINSSRAVTFWDRYLVQMIMRFNKIHKFSDGTLHQIDEALDYQVKEFKVNRMNPCLNIRFWTRMDVDRSKEFMFAIQKRLKTRRIFRNLESFVVDESEMATTDF
uniref:Uncharacterized protein n=1 Tax=Tanacetum cinerariifolium TaxID=118510 RepID=A0A6L2PA69_TANCI|nr:hypothetical protein [Tanacetum cinerariifolium]